MYKFGSEPFVIGPNDSASIPPFNLKPKANFFSEVLGSSALPPNSMVCMCIIKTDRGSNSVVTLPEDSSFLLV